MEFENILEDHFRNIRSVRHEEVRKYEVCKELEGFSGLSTFDFGFRQAHRRGTHLKPGIIQDQIDPRVLQGLDVRQDNFLD